MPSTQLKIPQGLMSQSAAVVHVWQPGIASWPQTPAWQEQALAMRQRAAEQSRMRGPLPRPPALAGATSAANSTAARRALPNDLSNMLRFTLRLPSFRERLGNRPRDDRGFHAHSGPI